ncbi:MAG: hypothetical protein CL908_17925 [Deltaproteobacteria bacterium]|nr:hypothetical protein [Deltaproteobacteria bacterium]
MNTLLSLLVVAAAGTGPVAPAVDPARLIPEDMSVFIELDQPTQLVGRIRGSAFWAEISGFVDDGLGKVLDVIEQAELSKAAIGLDHSFLRSKTKFVVFLQGADRAAIHKTTKAMLKDAEGVRVFKVGPFVGITDSKSTFDAVKDVAAGDEDPLSMRKNFQTFRAEVVKGQLRYHVDLKRLVPLRPGVAEPDDAGAAFLAGHILLAAGRANVVSGFIDLSRGLKVKVAAAMGKLPKDRRFCAPSGPVLPTLDIGSAARLSLRRDVADYWKNVEDLIPEGARTGLAEFRSTVGVFLGGLAVEDLFAGLGTSFDVYVKRLPTDGPSPRNRYPTGALVTQVKDKKLARELLIGFQELIGIINIENSQQGRPRMLIGSKRFRETDIMTARFLPDMLPEKDDDRLQLEVCVAFVGERLIVGSHSSIVQELVGAALDGKTLVRAAGDTLRVTAAGAMALLKDAKGALTAQMVLNGRTSEQADTLIDRIGRIVGRAESLSVDVVVRDGLALVDLDLDAPRLWSKQGGQK